MIKIYKFVAVLHCFINILKAIVSFKWVIFFFWYEAALKTKKNHIYSVYCSELHIFTLLMVVLVCPFPHEVVKT